MKTSALFGISSFIIMKGGNHTKKTVSLFLVCLMVFSSLTPFASAISAADEHISNTNTESITLKFVSDTILEEVHSTDVLLSSSDSILAQKSTENPDVFVLPESNEYVMTVGVNQYQLADRIDLFITDSSQIANLNVPQEIKDTIAQDLLNSPTGYIEGTIFTPTFKQTRDTEVIDDYQYQNYSMRQYLYTYKNFEATNVNVTKGEKTKERISAAIDFVYTLVTESMPEEYLMAFSPYTTAATLFADFCEMIQSDVPFETSSHDSVHITPHWDRYLKFTYCDYFHDGNYMLGLKSIAAHLTEIEYDIYFMNAYAGENEDFSRYYNKNIYSPNYQNPNATAVAYAPVGTLLEDVIYWRIYSKTEDDISEGSSGTLLCVIVIQ